MVTTKQQSNESIEADGVTVFPLETPDEDIAYCLNFLRPILEGTITKLYDLGKPGWGSYCELFYQTISDVMVSANAEEGT